MIVLSAFDVVVIMQIDGKRCGNDFLKNEHRTLCERFSNDVRTVFWNKRLTQLKRQRTGNAVATLISKTIAEIEVFTFINKTDLRGYRAICAEITNRESRLEDSTIHVVDVVQGAAQFPYNKHSVRIEGDLYALGASTEQKKIALLKIKKREIEDAVGNIEDHCVRYAITRKFLDDYYGERVTWELIADELGNTTGDAVKQRVSRFLSQQEREVKENE